MKILAWQLAIDMYNCKPEKLGSKAVLPKNLKDALTLAGFTPLESSANVLDENHFVIFIPLKEGHFTIHVYALLRYASIDLFICEQNKLSEKVVRILRKTLKPQELKMTYLCRGDFGTVTDMKPHIKIKTTPLRRIHNTGVKVIHLLPGRKLMKKLRRKRQ